MKRQIQEETVSICRIYCTCEAEYLLSKVRPERFCLYEYECPDCGNIIKSVNCYPVIIDTGDCQG